MSNIIEFKKKMKVHIDEMIKNPLFLTDVSKEDMWETYIEGFPDGTNEIYKERREHDCNCCKSFIRAYGNLVTIKNNQLVSIWDVVSDVYPYNVVAEKMSKLVKSVRVKDVFVAEFQNLGTDKNRQGKLDDQIITWDHLYYKLPKSLVNKSSKSIESIQGSARDIKNVFKRSMDELTIDAAETIIDLTGQGSLYRGEEFVEVVTKFIEYKKQYDNIDEESKDNWCWLNCKGLGKIRNSAIGTLLIDLSKDLPLDESVKKWEKVMAPSNYKRPNAIYTKKMVADAMDKVKELGYEDSLGRKFATLEDITVNNVLWVNREAKKVITGNVFDELIEEIPDNSKKFDRVEEITIDDFVENVLPTATSIELMMENKHQSNLMSLIAPKDKEASSMLKWDNNFSWTYNGDITDSMKERVKKAGGNVNGVLRFSIQWNEKGDDRSDYDAHCIEPSGRHISFSNQGPHSSSGMLDVDIQDPGFKIAVENIIYTNLDRMDEGIYKFYVHNYLKRGKSGFSAEIEFDGRIYNYEYHHELDHKGRVTVAEIEFSKSNGIKFIKQLDSTTSTKEIWNIKTNKFLKVSTFMYSPNYWDGQKGKGNKHWFFFIDDCKNDNLPRGFFNEFLDDRLMEHKRVFEAVGAKMTVEASENQLSGLGFSSTKRNSITVRIDGKFKRVLKIKF
jgi:hypothetical protein